MDMNYDQSLIEEFRLKVYEYAREHEDEIDMEDLKKRIKSPEEAKLSTQNSQDPEHPNQIPDFMLRRLLRYGKNPGNLNAAMERFVEVFKFRAHHRVNKMTLENSTATELFLIQPFVVDGTDLNGNQLFIIRVKFFKNLPQ